MPHRPVGLLATAVSAAIFFVAGTTLADGEPPLVRIAGSDSMRPFLERMGKRLSSAAPALRVAVDGRGSSTGPPALLRDDVELASMTRPMNDVEREAFEARTGRPATAFAIAVDAVAVYVNAANPLERMTLAQIDAVFSRSRRCGDGGEAIERWGALGIEGEWAARRIGAYTTPPASGTQALFRQVALCGGRLGQTREQPGTRSVAMAVAESRYAIGVGTLAGSLPGIRPLSLPATDGSGWASTDEAEIRSGRYPFERKLFLYAKNDARGRVSPNVAAFLRFALSDAGQQIVQDEGFLGLDPGQAREQLARLD